MAKPPTPTRSISSPARAIKSEESAKWARPVILILLSLVTIAVFARMVPNEFLLLDDNITIADNPNLNPPTLTGILSYWNPAHAVMELYVPVTYTAWGICAKLAYVDTVDEQGWHLNPYIFHAASLLVHLVNVLLLFSILSRLTRHEWASAFGALLFALHPVQVEAVAWASGLKDLLGVMFVLLTLLQYLDYSDEKNATNPRARFLHLVLGGLAVVLGMLSKPNAVVAPLMAGIIGYFILRQPIRRIAFPVLIWLVLTLPVLAITSSLQPPIAGIGGSLAQRPLMASFTLALYLFKLAWPATLAMDYGWHTDAVLSLKFIDLLLLVPIALAGIVLFSRRKIPWLAAAICLFVAGVFPVLGLKTFHTQYNSTVVDHYLYPSMVGVALGLAFLLAQIRWANRRAVGYGIATLGLAALGIRSYFQLSHYTSNAAFFAHVSQVTPGSFLRDNYSMYLLERGMQFRIGSQQPGVDPATAQTRARQSEDYLAQARKNLDGLIHSRPEFPMSYRTYALLLIAQHDTPAAEQMIARYLEQVQAHRNIFVGKDLGQDQIEFARQYNREKFPQLAEQHLAQALTSYTANRPALLKEINQLHIEIRQSASQPAAR